MSVTAPALLDDRDDELSGPRELRADGGGQAEAHRPKPPLVIHWRARVKG
jgi:hypothetical protein